MRSIAAAGRRARRAVGAAGAALLVSAVLPPRALAHPEGWRQEAEIFADARLDPIGFGRAVAIDGDRVAASAPYGRAESSVLVLHRADGAWAPEVRIARPGPESASTFGSAIALSGDTLAVAAPGEGDGAVHVFVRDGRSGAWRLQARLTAEATEATGFGQSLALVRETLVVGAPLDGGTGAVHVFVRHRESWGHTARLTGRDSAAGDLFGRAVAFDGTTIAAGAPLHWGDADEPIPKWRGGVYAFSGAGSRWVEEAELGVPNVAGFHLLGSTVAVSGDTLVAGSMTVGGTPHAFRRTTAGWVDDAELLPAEHETSMIGLGHAVAASGSRVAVGCPWTWRGGRFAAGEVYLLHRGDDGTWRSYPILDADDPPGEFEFYGQSVALDGRTVVVSAPLDDENGRDTGAAYVYRIR